MKTKTLVSLCVLALCANAFSFTPTYRGLPSGYTQVEYIQSSGSQYIDLGIQAKNNLAFEFVMSWVSVPSDAGFCGARKGTAPRFYPLYYYQRWTYGYDNYYRDPEADNSTAAAGTIYTVQTELSNGRQSLHVEDEEGNVRANLSGAQAKDVDADCSLYLFGVDKSGSISGQTSARCYEMRVWSVDGEGVRAPVADFVPCLNASGTAGLYDLVGGKFLSPSAALTYGEVILAPVDPSLYGGNVMIGNDLANDWNEPANWSLGHVPTADEDVTIVNRSVFSTTAVSAKSLHLIGAGLKLGDEENRTRFTDNVALAVAGDLLAESNSALTVYAGRLADERLADLAQVGTTAYAALYAGATLVTVGGKMTVASGATLLPDCDPLTGTAVFFRPKDFEMDETAKADVLKRGWRWFKTPEGVAPVGVRYEKQTAMYHTYAFGPGYSSASQGGGYGSDAFGAANAAINTCTNVVDGVVYGEIYRRGGAYGSAYAPFLPGSQGGIQSDATMPDCRAPGAFVVQATGTATVRGAILAYGQKDSDWSHSSGGSIWIAANELKVSKSAIFDVHGGDTTSNARMPGAAGRLALMSGVGTAEAWGVFAATTELPEGYVAESRRIPGLVDALGGEKGSYSEPDPSYGVWQRPPTGTAVLVVPEEFVDADDVMISEKSVAAEGVSRTWICADGYWDRPENWDPAGAPTAADSLTIPSGICRAPNGIEAAALTVGAGARLDVASWYLRGYVDSISWPFAKSNIRSFMVAGDVQIAGIVSIGGSYTNICDAITGLVCRVGGDLTVSGEGKLFVTAAATDGAITTSNDVYAARTEFFVSGKLALADTATLIPTCDPYGGLPVRFVVGDLDIAEGALVSAERRGYDWLPDQADLRYRQRSRVTTDNHGGQSKYVITAAMSPGGGLSTGAGHGGVSPGLSGKTGAAYGNPYAPFLAGSCSHIYNWHAKDSGGVVWISATNGAVVAGSVSASAVRLSSSYTSGSGGSVWLSAKNGFSFGLNASIAAAGAQGGWAGAKSSGGGGRVSVMSGVTEEQLEQIALGTDPRDLGLTVSDGILSVAVDVSSSDGYPDSVGSATTVMGVMERYEVTVSATGIAAVAPEPNYGSALYDSGIHRFTAPPYGADPVELDTRRYPLVGYVVSNATEEVEKGYTEVLDLDVQENLTVYWIWDVPSRERPVDVDGVRTWVTVGDSFSARATLPDGHEFLYWWGNVTIGNATNDVFTFTVADKPYSFSSITRPQQDGIALRTWQYKDDQASGLWTDPGHWVDGIIPGRYDPVSVPWYYPVITASNFVMCGSIEWKGLGASLQILTGGDDVFEEAALVVTGSVLATGLSISIGSKGQTKVLPRVSIGGDLRLTNGTFTVCAREVSDDYTFASGAGFVTVGGTFELAGNATFKPQSDPYTGGSVKTVCDTFVLLENAKVDASALGFAADRNRKPYSLAPGMGNSYGIGAGHGGHGGNANGTYGSEYGFANSPVKPGSHSGVYQTYAPNAGGGLVRIHARDMDIRGGIRADAQAIGGQIVAASGGGIWLTAAEGLAFGENAVLQAKGSAGHGGNDGGAGGRIAIGWKLSAAQIEALAETGTYPGLRKGRFRTEDWFVERFGLVNRPSVAPGCVGSDPEKCAQKGSFTFLDATLPGLILMVR